MSTIKAHDDSENVKYSGDGVPSDVELCSTSRSTREDRWRMPPGATSVDPSGRHKWEIKRKFDRVKESNGQWGADPDEVLKFMAACESPAEKLFVIELLKEAETQIQHVSTAWSRADGWHITISTPFHVQRRHGCASWFRVYPQRPIQLSDNIFDRRDVCQSPDGDLYCRVDFLAVIHVETPTVDTSAKSPRPVVIEIDGKGNHSGRQKIRRDYTRNHKFQKIGVPVYRYLASDVNDSGYDTGAKVLSDLWAEAGREIEQMG
jgi:hypothetical protein